MTATVEAPSTGLGSALRDVAPLLLSVSLLMAGNGLTGTLVGIRGGLEGFGPSTVGTVLAGYYLGFVIGSLAAPATIVRVGHIRVFAGLASMASGAVLVHVVAPEPVTWFVLRAVSGMCISALYVVCETWLNGAATNRSRGSLLAGYMMVVSGSLVAGQVLFSVSDPAGFTPFVVSSVLVSLAVVPVSMATFPAPPAPEIVPIGLRRLVTVAPLGVVGSLLSGFIGAAMLGAGVVYAAEAGFDTAATGAFIGAALVGGVVLQFPLGGWSDRVDRRIVIAIAALAATGTCAVAAMVHTDRRLVLIALVTVAGGMTFPLYSLCSAHLNDHLDANLMVAAGSKLVLVNGVGSVAGPILGGIVVARFGPQSLFLAMAAGYGVIGVYALYRMTVRAAAAEEDRATFVPVVVGVGPTEVRPDESDIDLDELFPPTEGRAEIDDGTFPYREQGAGPPVVLVEVLPADELDRTGAWEDVMPALARDGMRAVVARSDGVVRTDDQRIDVLLALLRHLELPWATLVGVGAGAETVARFLAQHPDRTEAAILFGRPSPEALAAAEERAASEDESEEGGRPLVLLPDLSPHEDPLVVADHIAEVVRRQPGLEAQWT